MLFLFLGLLLSGLAAWGYTHHKRHSDDEGALIGGVIGTVFLGILLIAYTAFSLTNLAHLTSMEAFYTHNSLNYEVAMDETASHLSTQQVIAQALIPVEGSIEKVKLANVVAKRLVEYRDNVNRYNNDLALYRKFQSNFWLGAIFPTVPQHLKMLIMR